MKSTSELILSPTTADPTSLSTSPYETSAMLFCNFFNIQVLINKNEKRMTAENFEETLTLSELIMFGGFRRKSIDEAKFDFTLKNI